MAGAKHTSRGGPGRWHAPIWWLNGAAVAVLLLTYLAPHVSPARFWPLALAAMAFPYQLPVHAFFLVWWLLFHRRRMLLSAGALLIGWGHVGDHWQWRGAGDAPEKAGMHVKLMSWNVRLFDLYRWSRSGKTRSAIMQRIADADPDILCLQEFHDWERKPRMRNREKLLADFRFTQVHEAYVPHTRSDHRFGIATFSAHPIVDQGTIPLPVNTGNLCIWSDIDLGGDTVRVYNAHLASYHFGDADYRFLDSLDTRTQGDDLKRGGLRILRLLRRGFRTRAAETERIAAHMGTSPHPVVFCGDINDVPMSYAYRRLRKGRHDAFVESGAGTGGTYIGGRLPQLRIDHILHDPSIASWSFNTHPEVLSDHHAISCMLAVRRRE